MEEDQQMIHQCIYNPKKCLFTQPFTMVDKVWKRMLWRWMRNFSTLEKRKTQDEMKIRAIETILRGNGQETTWGIERVRMITYRGGPKDRCLANLFCRGKRKERGREGWREEERKESEKLDGRAKWKKMESYRRAWLKVQLETRKINRGGKNFEGKFGGEKSGPFRFRKLEGSWTNQIVREKFVD